MIESDFVTLDLLVFNNCATIEAPRTRENRSTARKMMDTLIDRERRRRLLFTLYERWDRRLVQGDDDPLALVDCSPYLRGIESLAVTPIVKRYVHRFPADSVERIRASDLDVLIRFGFNILRGEILNAARYGIWSYHHGDNDYYRGGPPYFWEVYEDNPISGAMLQVLTEELDAGHVLCKGLFATCRGLSQVRNRVQPYWGASTFVIQKLRELHESGWARLEEQMVKPAPYRGKKKLYRTPANWEMLRWLGPRVVAKSLGRFARQPTIMHWRMAVRRGAPPLADSTATPNVDDFLWIESPKGRFYADPFLLTNRGKVWAFFEDYDYTAQIGRISCAEVGSGGLAEPLAVLDRPYHLSYPCIFGDGDDLYMIPESVSNGTVELYRCVAFPNCWKLERVLLDLPAVDSTVWFEDGLYWFFITMREPRGAATQLWLFFAGGLGETWRPHPANPISTDVRNSRGGGAIFRHNGRLFRPSQDCSRDYGSSFTLNEIVTLNPLEYREKPRVTVEPAWKGDWVGTHTYGRSGDIEIIDGCARLPAAHVLK